MPLYKKQMLARNILCSLILKLNVMDVKLYDLPLLMIQPFQDTGSLELEETERGVSAVAFSIAVSC